jgi:AcrR family transcriptional regulator
MRGDHSKTRERIIEATLDLADRIGWGQVRLYDVARLLKLGPGEIRRHFRDLDAIGDAWLMQAEIAMLKGGNNPRFAELPARARLEQSLSAFLNTLSAHRPATAGLLRAKLYFGHPHHQIGLVLWVSRTVQWWREAAKLANDSGGPVRGDRRRRAEEIGLTGIFLATLWFWTRDSSTGFSATHHFLARQLAGAEILIGRAFPQAKVQRLHPRPSAKRPAKRRKH